MQVITTVITPATDFDLTTVEYVLDDLDEDDSSSETLIKRWITQASKAAARYCKRVFVVETVKDEFWTRRGDYWTRMQTRCDSILQLSRWPIKAGTTPTVVEDGVTLTATTDFRINFDTGQLLRMDGSGNAIEWRGRVIAVTYDAGYETIPEDLADAVLRLVRARWFARGRDPNLRQESIPDLGERQLWVPDQSDIADMPLDVSDLLDRFRNPFVA